MGAGIDIPAVSATAVRRARDGRWFTIDRDTCDIARRLREVDDSLRVRWSDTTDPVTGREGFFVVFQETERPDGDIDQHLVLTTAELDARVVDRVREITSPGYDYASELEAIDRARDREIDRRFSERIGEVGERLAHAVRKDTGDKGRAFVGGKGGSRPDRQS